MKGSNDPITNTYCSKSKGYGKGGQSGDHASMGGGKAKKSMSGGRKRSY